MRLLLTAFWALMATLCVSVGAEKVSRADTSVTKEEVETMNQWVDGHLLDAKPKLPFSFVYGEKTSEALLAEWPKKVETKKLDAARSQHILTWTDPTTGLEVRCVAVTYRDFPTVEWTLHFKNIGAKDSPIISRIQALDTTFRKSGQGAFLLHHNVGSPADASDYAPRVTPLAAGAKKRISAAGGRPTNSDMSYFNLEWSGSEGMIVVVGWPGQWAADFVRDTGDGIVITAGQELTHLKLLPGEAVRSPLMVLQYWKGGDWIRAQNVWRRWMLAHNVPRPGGKLPEPELFGCSAHFTGEMTGATEENQIQWISRFLEEKIKIGHYWMDAGWYACKRWPETGTWEVDLKRFPRGLRAISDYAHTNGVKTILWFEPERVAAGTWLAENHAEWILGGKKGGLLNLSNAEALQWLVEHVDTLMKAQGIDLYRQDFNMDPLNFWRGNDAPDRQGITENKHIVGYLAFWDELLRRHPDMFIDACASGGRRNDLETMRRAISLWRSDSRCDPVATQGHTYGISLWLPLSGAGTANVDSYSFRSNMAPFVNCLWSMRKGGQDYDLMRRLTGEFAQIASYWCGDYYPLADQDAWMAWQFVRPEQHKGVVQVFRRDKAPAGEMRIKLRGLDAEATYELNDFDKTAPSKVSGRELMETGLLVMLPPRAAAVIVYRAL